MATTSIADVQVPVRYADYIVQLSTSLSELWTSGIVGTTPEIAALASGGGVIINLPFWQDLTGADEVLAEGALTPAKFTSGNDVARKHGRGKAWGAYDLAGELAGDDPLEALANRIATWWARRMQDMVISTLTGVFGDALAATHVNTAAAGDSVIAADDWLDTEQLLGDAKDRLTAICIHSAMENKMKGLDLIDFEHESDQGTPIPYYMGKSVLVDDNCPVADGVYRSYMFGPGALAYAEAPVKTPFETGRNHLSGIDEVVTRRQFYLHPRGVAWQEDTCTGEFPTNAELETTANWSDVYSVKDIRMVALDARVAAAVEAA